MFERFSLRLAFKSTLFFIFCPWLGGWWSNCHPKTWGLFEHFRLRLASKSWIKIVYFEEKKHVWYKFPILVRIRKCSAHKKMFNNFKLKNVKLSALGWRGWWSNCHFWKIVDFLRIDHITCENLPFFKNDFWKIRSFSQGGFQNLQVDSCVP